MQEFPSPIIVLRSTAFYVAATAITLPWLPLLPACLLLPIDHRQRFMESLWSNALLVVLRICCGIRLRVEGLEHLTRNSCVIMCNHQSPLETLLHMHFAPGHIIAVLLKQELLNIPVFGWALRIIHTVAIDRSEKRKALEDLLRQGQQHLREGRDILVFPGGTRSPYGQKERYLLGGFRLAEQSGVAIQPIAHNAGRYWRGFFKYPGEVRVQICPPIAPQGNANVLRALVKAQIEAAQEDLARLEAST